jgi:hypothetical protein
VYSGFSTGEHKQIVALRNHNKILHITLTFIGFGQAEFYDMMVSVNLEKLLKQFETMGVILFVRVSSVVRSKS